MDGVVRQLYDYDGSNLFPRTKPSAFVSDFYDSSATGVTTIGEWIDTSVPGEYTDPVTEEDIFYEPEFVYRIPVSDTDLLGGADASGALRATKLSHVKALRFDAKLTEPITVSYQVGQATIGKTYEVNTPLEDIIRDMLTGGASVYDVKRNLPGTNFTISYTNNGEEYYPLSPDQVVNVSVGSDLKFKLKFIFADGSYGPTPNYSDASFTALNSTGPNTSWFVQGNPPYLRAGTSATLLKLVSGGTSHFSYNNPTSGAEYMAVLPTVTEGSTLYMVSVDYSPAQSIPYKSDGQLSENIIGNGSNTFNFTINGVHVAVYDVRLANTPDLSVGKFWHESDYIGVDVYDRNYVLSADNAKLVIKSRYDVDNDSSTGVWTGDSICVYTKKSLYPSWSYLVNGTQITVNCAGTEYPVISPVVYYYDGMFEREADYPVNLFRQYNPTASANSMYSQCNLDDTTSVCVYRGNTEIYTQQTPYRNKVSKLVADWDHPTGSADVSIVSRYALWFANTYNNETLIDTGSVKMTTAGNHTLKFKVPYTNNTAIPKKSDGTNSSIGIRSNTLIKTSDVFVVNQEVDVSVTSPNIRIDAIIIDGVGTYYNNNVVDLSTNIINGRYAFTVNNKEGLFTPKSGYSNAEFNTNNNTSGGRLTAGCQPGTFTLKVDGTIIGTCAGSSLDSTGHGSIYFNNLTINGNFSAEITGEHSGSTVTAYKRSTRPSNERINATSALRSNQFIIRTNMPQEHTVKLIANPSTGGTVKFSTSATAGATDTSIMSGGASFTAVASPARGWSFTDWRKTSPTGTQISTNSTYNGTAGSTDLTLYANFTSPSAAYTARLLTTDKLLETGTASFISGINSVEDILAKKTTNTQEWTTAASATLNDSSVTYGFSAMNFGTNGTNGRTIVAVIPSTWNLCFIDLQLDGNSNSYYGTVKSDQRVSWFDTATAVTTLPSSDGNTYTVYAKKNPGTVGYQVNGIKFYKRLG